MGRTIKRLKHLAEKYADTDCCFNCAWSEEDGYGELCCVNTNADAGLEFVAYDHVCGYFKPRKGYYKRK